MKGKQNTNITNWIPSTNSNINQKTTEIACINQFCLWYCKLYKNRNKKRSPGKQKHSLTIRHIKCTISFKYCNILF